MSLRGLVRWVFLVAAAGAAAGCEDLSPLDYQAPGRDAAADSGKAVACRECASSDAGACRPEYDICSADAGCKAVIDCILAVDCLRQLDVDQTTTNLPECATSCIEQAGVTINEIVVPVAQFFLCVSDESKCMAACFEQ